MKSERNSNFFVIICFMLFLLGSMVLTVISPKKDTSYFENRALAARPVLIKEAVMDGSYFTDMEKYLVDHAALRTEMLAGKTVLDEFVFHRPVVNDVVVKQHILLPYNKPHSFSQSDVEATAERFTTALAQFQTLVESYGGVFYYVGVPCQFAYYEDEYPWYLENMSAYTHAKLAAFTAATQRQGVNFIDMGSAADRAGHPDWFSSTVDNHFSLKGAYLTYETIVDAINQDTDLNLALPGEGELIFEPMPNRYTGSRSRKLFGLTTVSDQLMIGRFTPEIPFTREDYGNPTASTVYAMPENESDNLLYGFYMGGDLAETLIDTQREELPSALIYGDSFTNALECLAYYSFDEMRTVDLRHYMDMSLAEYVQLHQPEVVICIRDYEELLIDTYNGNMFG